jgi:hypothetical protein
MSKKYVRGYLIQQEICFEDNHGYALGENAKEAFGVAVWQFDEVNGSREYTKGRYFIGKDADLAALDFGERVSEYKAKSKGIAEKYNYLAAAEMSGEQNYNQIDGIPNNGYKPSILEQLREFQATTVHPTDKDGKPQAIER